MVTSVNFFMVKSAKSVEILTVKWYNVRVRKGQGGILCSSE